MITLFVFIVRACLAVPEVVSGIATQRAWNDNFGVTIGTEVGVRLALRHLAEAEVNWQTSPASEFDKSRAAYIAATDALQQARNSHGLEIDTFQNGVTAAQRDVVLTGVGVPTGIGVG